MQIVSLYYLTTKVAVSPLFFANPLPSFAKPKMPDPTLPPSEFVVLVRSALAHLYDHAFLQNHPLAAMLDRENALDRPSRSQRVRRLLIDCINRLSPPTDAPADSVRAYIILNHHYLDGLPIPAVAEKLGLSQRQAYRELEKGIKATANLLWEEIGRDAPAAPAVLSKADAPDARIETAQQEVERLRPAARAENVDLHDLLDKISALLLPLCQQTDIQIEFSAPERWPSVVTDRTMLRQALLNLLSYLIRIVRGNLVIAVSNHIEGWEINLSESAPASRGAFPLAGDDGQTEIGLAVARSLIEGWGGRLATQQIDGKWQAQVILPMLRRATVLTIDDNADIVALFQRYLGGYAVSVVGMKNAEDAMRLAAELQPQVITLDVMMPDQDGWEILQKLKSAPKTKQIPVIICSVLHEPQLAEALGASGYVTKPISQAKLVETLQHWLGPLQIAS
jgi:CheY-like chemotaxis protein